MANNIKIAYMISCYKLPEQVINLVKMLQHEQDIFLIHVDKKSSKNYFEKISSDLSEYNNVVFLPRHKCYWGDYGHVRSTLKGLQYLAGNNIDYTNLVVITGQDYPVYNLEKTRDLIYGAGNSMEYFELPASCWADGGLDRLYRYHFWIAGKHYSLGGGCFEGRAKRLLKLIGKEGCPARFYGGSSYFQVEADIAKFILGVKHMSKLRRFFRHAYISDEIFFHTIILNSSHKNRIKNDSMRYVDWTDPAESPKILRINDLDRIMQSKAIFARKLDSSVDDEVILKLGVL